MPTVLYCEISLSNALPVAFGNKSVYQEPSFTLDLFFFSPEQSCVTIKQRIVVFLLKFRKMATKTFIGRNV